MNTGAFGEGFPYVNFHDLNMDWIIKIAKDFLDQYTHLQETIDTGMEDLQTKYEQLETLLNEWYDTHSQDIADELADALEDLNDWYTTHENYLNQTLTDNVAAFQTQAQAIAAEVISSIPEDYTDLSNHVTILDKDLFALIKANATVYYPIEVADSYINENGGVASTTSDSSTTKNIYVNPGEYVLIDNVWTRSIRYIAGYNASNQTIWTLQTGIDDPTSFGFVVPENTEHIKYTFASSDISTIYIWNRLDDSFIRDINDKTSRDIFTFFTKTQKSSGATYNSNGSLTIPAGGYLFAGLSFSTFIPNSGLLFIYGETDRPFSNTTLEWSEQNRYSTPSFMHRHRMIEKDNKFFAVIDTAKLDRVNCTTLVIRFDNRDDTEYSRTITNVKCFTVRNVGSIYPCYISPSGNDSNDGTVLRPLATATEAVRRGYSNIICEPGVYEQEIEFRVPTYLSIRAKDKTQKVVFKSPTSTIATSETKVLEHAKVYSVTTDKEFAAGNDWIFQENVPDTTTLISDDDRLPQQRGQEYRCNDTKIIKCTSETLNDALTEIDNYDGYKWFLDGTTLYYSRPHQVTSEYPICGSFTSYLLRLVTSGYRPTVELTGIDFKYMIVNITNTVNSRIIDCKSSNVFGAGCFQYDGSTGIEFIRCEAEHCYQGATGDGFNGHSTIDGDTFSKQTTCILEDCWSHDNNDDGYSDHERSETVIRGGLYEWNGKAGITPSYGSHCSCYGVISRDNFSGFACVGEAEDGGKYTQMLCVDCIAEHNVHGGYNAGFAVAQAGNRAILINCKSIGNSIGYYCLTDTSMRILDCCTKDNTSHVYTGAGTITIENTTPVTE